VTSAWAARGVRIFRVDNPHTKPFAFWEWLIAEIKREHPETIFLSEAFTRPKVMHRLAKVGFDQSYTYFTWRDEKWELSEYFEELAHGQGRTYFCPNVWPNTPDILARSLQHGGRASFVARLVLAGGLSANYGIYGPVFELMWDEPAAPGSEEYLHSEKYEVRHHDLDDPHSLRDVVSRVNAARKAHPSLQRQSGLRFLPVDNEQIIAWMKRDDSGEDVVVGVVNLDPHWVQAGFVELDLAEFGIAAGTPFPVRDLLTDSAYVWQAGRNYVQLDPAETPAHLLALERP
jgi:starch synthase (maltosyl-transferring)